jgi:hypothetical protein
MGKEKSSGTTVVNQQTTPTPTAEETEMNKLALERERAGQQGMIDIQQSGLSLGNQLLQGNANLPGFFSSLSGGINEDVTGQIVQNSLKDIYPQFQQSGIMDSGVAASIAGRTAGDIRMNAAEYNQQNLFNLLNLAFGGQAQIQTPILNQSSILSQRLAGLRSTNVQGTTTNTQSSMNPFMKSFQTSLGSRLGNPQFSTGPFTFGGG